MQDRDPRAFQLMLQTPEGASFLGSTPELLYRRSGNRVASEAVAATRPRGPPGRAWFDQKITKSLPMSFDESASRLRQHCKIYSADPGKQSSVSKQLLGVLAVNFNYA